MFHMIKLSQIYIIYPLYVSPLLVDKRIVCDAGPTLTRLLVFSGEWTFDGSMLVHRLRHWPNVDVYLGLSNPSISA